MSPNGKTADSLYRQVVLFRGFFVLMKEGLMKYGLYLLCGLYSEVDL